MSRPLHPAAQESDSILSQCKISFTRRAGPGGQNRNKVETAVILDHSPSGIRAEANERRSQLENRNVALTRLRLRLALEVRVPVKPDDTPSALWRSRCRGGRIAVNPGHADFPSLLSEALDFLHAHHFDVKAAASRLDCSATQIVKLLQLHPPAMKLLNDERAKLELRPLR